MEKQYESDEIEIDLKDLFFELLGEWKKIVVSMVLAGLIMFVVSAFIITPQYQSTSKLYLLKEDVISSITDLQIGTNLATDYMEIVDGRPILDQVIANLGLDMTYGELRGILAFSNPTNSRIIEITATHPDPQTAKAIVDEMADVTAEFIRDKMAQDKPSVLQYGYVASSPVSPSIAKNTVLGAAVGAFLAIAIIVVTYLMNDTIMTPDDMERKVGLHVLASLPFDEEEDDGVQRSSSSSSKGKKKSGSHSKSSSSSKTSKSVKTSTTATAKKEGNK